jgi:hypothetical protein
MNDETNTETDPFHLPIHELDEPFSSTFNTSLEFKERLDELNLSTDRSHFQRLFSSRRDRSDEQQMLTARSKSARTSSKKNSSLDSDWISESARLNRYVLKKHEDARYGTLHTPRLQVRRIADDDIPMSTVRSTLRDLSLTHRQNTSSSSGDLSNVYCPTIEEVHG